MMITLSKEEEEDDDDEEEGSHSAYSRSSYYVDIFIL